MVEDAKSHAEDDKKRREETEVRNRADSLIYTTEKTLEENKEKLPASDVEAVEKSLEELRKAAKDGTVAEIEQAMEALTKASHALAEILYKQASTEGASSGEGAAPPPGGGGGEGDVIDAEVVDKDPK